MGPEDREDTAVLVFYTDDKTTTAIKFSEKKFLSVRHSGCESKTDDPTGSRCKNRGHGCGDSNYTC